MKDRRTLLVCLLWVMSLLGTAWTLQQPASSSATSRKNAARARAAEFFRGRQSPDREPAAEHLFKARMQARAMRVARPQGSGFDSNAVTTPKWIPVGPQPEVEPASVSNFGAVSGEVTAVAVDLNADPTGYTLYVGTANGGLWKSTNAQSANPTFIPLTDNASSLSVGSIAIDSTTQPSTIYVGTGEGNFFGDAYDGTGILRSTDGGQTWQSITWADQGKESFFGLTINRILIDPANSQHLVAATGDYNPLYHVGTPYSKPGIYQSTDGGLTWSLAAQFMNSGYAYAVTDLVWDPGAKLYYAAVSQMGLYSSTDGLIWKQVSSPILDHGTFNGQSFGRASLAVRNGTLYILYCDSLGYLPSSAPDDTGLAQSTDQGQTWTPIAAPYEENLATSQFLAAPANSTELIFGGQDVWLASSVSRSSTNWQDISQGEIGGVVATGHHAIAVVDPNTLFVGNNKGLWFTGDAGADWNNDNQTLATVQFNSVAPSSGTPGVFVGAAQAGGFAVTNNDGTQTWTESLPGNGGATVFDPADPSVVYGGMGSAFLFRSSDGGHSFNNVVDPALISNGGNSINPIAVVPSRPWLVVMGAGNTVWMGPGLTSYDGEGWKAISPSLTYENLTGLAVAPSDANVMYKVTDSGGVYGTINALSTNPAWNTLNAPQLPATTGALSSVAVHPTDPKTVYIGYMDFDTGHVFKSTDGGASWLDVSGNLPDAPVNSIVVDPEHPDDVYVGTDVGVFVATDGGVTGEQWQQMGTGLPNAPVLNIQLSNVGNRVLVAATNGRGAWTIPALSNTPDFSLQLNPDLASSIPGQPTTLTATVAAINGFTGTVALTCQAPSTGCSVQPASLQAGQSATITLDPNAFPGGSGVVTLSAAAGAITHTQNAQVQTQALILDSNPVDLEAGDYWGVNNRVSVANSNATVSGLTCLNLPAGVTCQFDSTELTTGQALTKFNITADSTATPGTTTIQIAGTQNGQALSAPLTLRVHGFDLNIANTTLQAQSPTSSVTDLIQAGAQNGSANPIALSCDPSSGVTCSFSPASIVPGQSSTLTISSLNHPVDSTVNVNIIGTSGQDQRSYPVAVTIVSDPIQLSADPSSIVVAPGTDTASFTIYDFGYHDPSQTMTFSCLGNAAVQCAFSQSTNFGFGYSTGLTVSGLSNLPAGTLSYTVQVQASLPGEQKTLPIAVNFGDFSLSPSDTMQVISKGTDSASFTFQSSAVSGFNSTITYFCLGDGGMQCTVTPASAQPGQPITVQASGLSNLPVGSEAVLVIGTSGPLQHQVYGEVQISDFALSTPQTTVSIPPGVDTESFLIHASSQNDRGIPIQLGCTTTAAVTCSFTPANLVPNTSSTLTISGLKAAGASGAAIQVGVTGIATTAMHTLPLTLKPQTFAASPLGNSATSETIMAGQTAKFSLTYSSMNGFSGPVTLSCSGGPAASTCSVTPPSFNLADGGSQTAIVSVSTATGAQLFPLVGGSSRPWREGLALLGLLGLFAMAFTRRRQLILSAAILFAGALLLAGCGGGGAGGGAIGPRTPAGTSQITVTATSNGVSQSTTLNLTVQ